MTWTAKQTASVKQALIGSWPGTITAWGAEAINAYLYVLQARGLTAEQVTLAIGTWPAGSDFPPSAPNLAAQALRDPSKPTFREALRLIRTALAAGRRPLTGNFSNEAEMLKARARAAEARAAELHPLVASFIERYRLDDLQQAISELADEQYGAVRLRDLERQWNEHCERTEGRDVAALASGRRRGELGHLDPLAALGLKQPAQIEAGS